MAVQTRRVQFPRIRPGSSPSGMRQPRGLKPTSQSLAIPLSTSSKPHQSLLTSRNWLSEEVPGGGYAPCQPGPDPDAIIPLPSLGKRKLCTKLASCLFERANLLRKIRSKPKCKFANLSVIGFGHPVRYETTGDSRLMGRTPVAQTVT